MTDRRKDATTRSICDQAFDHLNTLSDLIKTECAWIYATETLEVQIEVERKTYHQATIDRANQPQVKE